VLTGDVGGAGDAEPNSKALCGTVFVLVQLPLLLMLTLEREEVVR